jgi:steroid Delta-isomerase
MKTAQMASDELSAWFERLSLPLVAQLPLYYAADARFKDPYNEVQGLPAITHVFEHMYVAVRDPRFVITDRVVQGQQAFMLWEFHFQFRQWAPSTPQIVRGTTHFRFNEQGLVQLHRDYWDAAEEVYEKLPVLGGLMRLIKWQANR